MPPRYSWTCTLPDCDKPFRSRGYCEIHYRRWKRHGDPYGGGRYEEPLLSDEDRFLKRIDKETFWPCWVWTASTITAGYAELKVDGRDVYVHRWSYQHFKGPIPPGYTIDHLCHTHDITCLGGVCHHRRCVNPSHLEAVTAGENNRRGHERAAGRTQLEKMAVWRYLERMVAWWTP